MVYSRDSRGTEINSTLCLSEENKNILDYIQYCGIVHISIPNIYLVIFLSDIAFGAKSVFQSSRSKVVSGS